MVTVETNGKFGIEKKYLFDVIFSDFLGVRYDLKLSDQRENFILRGENSKKLVIRDHFFKHFKNEEGYLAYENIPKNVQFSGNPFLLENDIPIIYGNDEMCVSEESITCGIDIFASTFFMLTRWEEYVDKTRDKNGRFPASASLAYKNGFLDRPVVNEYVEMLWNMLVKLGIEQKRKERNFEMLLTHDVDCIQKYGSMLSGCREIAGDILKRHNPSEALLKLKDKVLIHSGRKRDPYDTFDYLIDISDKAGVKSIFFLMAEGVSRYDNAYKTSGKLIKKIVNNIMSRGHNVGLHATYGSYKDKNLLAKEKTEIENLTGVPIRTGRQHYLRFEVPATWQVWEDNGMEWDSTLSYADREGFRCGTCYEYSAFNFLTRKKLKLKEKPLIVMDGSFVNYQPEITAEEMESRIQALVDKCRKYNGTFVFLWHNSSFGTPVWEQFGDVYEDIVTQSVRSLL